MSEISNLADDNITYSCGINLGGIIIDLEEDLCEWLIQRGEWPSGLYSLRQVTEVKLGRVRSDFGWVTSED